MKGRRLYFTLITNLLTNHITYAIFLLMPRYDSLRKTARDLQIQQYASEHSNLSHQEIADKFGMSRSNVTRILKKALRK